MYITVLLLLVEMGRRSIKQGTQDVRLRKDTFNVGFAPLVGWHILQKHQYALKVPEHQLVLVGFKYHCTYIHMEALEPACLLRQVRVPHANYCPQWQFP